MRVRRGSPLPSPARVGAAFGRVPQLRRKRSGVLVCYSRGRGGRGHKTHRASAFPATFLFLRLLHGGFHTPGVPRSVRGVIGDMPNTFFLPLFAFYLGGDHFAPRNCAVLQKFKHALAGVTL